MKFSFKKGGGDKAAKVAKRVSRASGQDGLAMVKTFLLNHLEKILVAAIVIVALLIVHSGWKKDRLQSDPDKLLVEVNSARTTVQAQTWPEVKDQRLPREDTFDRRAAADTVAINDENFDLPMPLHPILKERQKRRTDPPLIAAQELEVSAGYGPLAIRSSDSTGPGRMSELFRPEEGTENTRPIPPKYAAQGRNRLTAGASATESTFFVCVTGLVPIQQQFEAYREAFEGAAEYVAERDTPRYLAMNVQRATVGADGQPGEWTDLNSFRVMQLEPARWEGQWEEQASSNHVIKSLVMPLPPLKFRDVSQWAVHSKIPTEAFGSEPGGVHESPTADRPEQTPEGQPLDLFQGAGARTEGRSGEFFSSTESGGEDRPPDADLIMANRPKIDFGLLRYFDFSVEPGMAYAYRIQLVLEDPNNPREFPRPATASCETSVVVRRQANPTKNWVETPWSEPSPPVLVPSGQMILAGPVEQPRMVAVTAGNRRVRLTRRPGEEPEADVMAVVWDRSRAMDVPAEIRVSRGSVVNEVVTTEAIDPARSVIVQLQDYDLRTNALVLDIAGGEPLDRAGKLRAPGLMLLMKSDGQFVFHQEVDDYDQFDYFTIPEDESLMRRREPEREAEPEENRDRRRGRRGERVGDEPSVEGPN